MKINTKAWLLLGCLIILGACTDTEKPATDNNEPEEASSAPLTINYGVVRTLPHDVTAFTEGLLFYNGKLYESTGSPAELTQTRSLIGEVDLKTGTLQQKIEIDRARYFGEGIVFLNDKIYQLTYTTKVGFIYDAKTFKQIGAFTLPTKEGWGFTTDGIHLIMSDGTPNLTYLDPASLKVVKTVVVSDENGAVTNLNELEYAKGFLYANVYTTPYIIKIDPQTGKVSGRIDLSALQQDAKSRNPNSLEMNGIAFDSTANSLYITGKLWPTMYEIKVSM